MLIYLIFFVIVGIIAYIWEKNINKKIISFILAICIILLISIFAGCRDENVGTDIHTYIKPVLISLSGHDLKTVYKTANIEWGTLLLLYATKFWNYNLNVALLLIQLPICILVVMYAYKNREKQSAFIIIMAYICMIFGFTLNLMRQCIAMAFVLYANIYIREGKLKKFLLFIAIACMFHTTALIFIPIYFAYNGRKGMSKIARAIILLGSLCLLFSISSILNFGIETGLVGKKYNSYLTRFNKNSIQINTTFILLKLAIGTLCVYITNGDSKMKMEGKFYRYLLVIDIILFLLGSKISFAERLSYYFSMSSYLYCFSRGEKIVKQKGIYNIMILGIFLFYFYIVFVYLDNSQIIPYTSKLLGI